MIATLIDITALFKMLYASLIASVAVAVVFSLAVLGAIRSGDMRRSRRGGASAAYLALAALAVLVSAAIVVFGLIVVVRK